MRIDFQRLFALSMNIVELQHPVRNDYNGCSVLCGVLVFDMHEW